MNNSASNQFCVIQRYLCGSSYAKLQTEKETDKHGVNHNLLGRDWENMSQVDSVMM